MVVASKKSVGKTVYLVIFIILNIQLLTFIHVILSSQADNIHLMLRESNNWQEVLTSSDYMQITKVDIHTGLSVADAPNESYQHWEECITGVIGTLKPQIICVHHNELNDDNIKGVAEKVNQRHYLMQASGESWYIWYR